MCVHCDFVRSLLLNASFKSMRNSWACVKYMEVQGIMGVFYPGLLVQT